MNASLIHNTKLYNFLNNSGIDRNVKGHYVLTAGKIYNFNQNVIEGAALMMLQQRMLVENIQLTFIIHD